MADYQLRGMKRGWQVAIPIIRGGKVRRWQVYSKIYRDKVEAEAHLAARLEQARQFAVWCDGVLAAEARRREAEQ